jgi:Protein of unknown function (DUF1018)
MQPFKRKAPDERRRAELAAIHVRAKTLGIEGEDYHAFIKGITGQESAAGLDACQRGAVLDRLRALGARSHRTNGNEGRSGEPQERLAIAVWRELGDLGVLHDPSDAGLRKFAAKLTGVDRIEWADARQMNKIIEALKAWKRRDQLKQAG